MRSISFLITLLAAYPASAQTVDLALVLAVDVSNSMNGHEQRIQRQGYVHAFHDPNLVAAVETGATGRIAVAYLEWAGPGQERLILPWTLVDDKESAEQVAGALRSAQIGRGHGTSISSALLSAASLLTRWEGAAMRRVIDLSGDGVNNTGPPISVVRDRITAAGITINGLPIHLQQSVGDLYETYSLQHLNEYFSNCVATGPGAFVIAVEGIEALGDAIKRKLIREIAGMPPSIVKAEFPVGAAQSPHSYDCMSAMEQNGR
jgi:hypothetical protein